MKRQIITLAIVLAASFLLGLAGCSAASQVAGHSETGSNPKSADEHALMFQSYEKERDRLLEEAVDGEEELKRQNDELSRISAARGVTADQYEATISQLVGENHEFSETVSRLREHIAALTAELENKPKETGKFGREVEYPYKKVLSVGVIGTYNLPDTTSQPDGYTRKNAYLEVLCCVYPGTGTGVPETFEDCFLLVRFFIGEQPSSDIAWVHATDVEPYNAETRSHLKSCVTIKEGAKFWVLDNKTGVYVPSEEVYSVHRGRYDIEKIEDEFAYIFWYGPTHVKCYAKDLVYPDF